MSDANCVTEVRVAGWPVILTGWPAGMVTVGRVSVTVSVTVTSVADGLADAWKADLNWKLQISNNQCGLDRGRSSANAR